jgi:glycosyltransferase involved in cell wall biosynthesis
MRIAQIAPASLPVPPNGYGGIEMVVALLADGLTDRGHEVTLFASGGSKSRADLVTLLDEAPGTGNVDAPVELAHTLGAYTRAEDFDLIHDHSVLGAAVGGMLGGHPPVVHTLHGPWSDTIRPYYGLLHDRIHLVAISEAQKAGNGAIGYAGVVHNGIDVAAFRYREDKDDFLLFVGRSNPEKGPEHAVEVAKAAGMPLKMVVKRSEPEEQRHWDEQVEPRLTGDEEIIDSVEHEAKVDLFSRAKATLFPIRWEEPFGLVMVESMVCGTPVIAAPRGAAVEVVDDGVTGFLREGVDAMVAAVRAIDTISPEACRSRVEKLFSAEAMVDGYEALYRGLGADGKARAEA